MESTSLDALRARYDAAGQGHVFRHWADLDEPARAEFRAELEGVDLALVARLGALIGQDGSGDAPTLEPAEVFPLERGGEREEELTREAADARARGAELLAAGKVAFVLVAGGQGSRLGFDGPKGAYEIGPVTDMSLFAWHAARIQAAGSRHGFAPRWYVMTSAANDATTKEYFASKAFFGLDRDSVVFFRQDMLPALDAGGRIVLAERGGLFLAPNGHGGTLAALATSGALADMREAGIEQLSYFQVDNPLGRPADPLFIGLHDLACAQMSSKVVAKRDAGEKVGVIGLVDGRLGCIEYSDLSDELRDARTDSGALVFNAGNIAAHMIRRDFVEELTSGGDLDLPWHVARKQLDSIDADAERVKIDGVKFETFVFDALGRTRASVVLEVDRAEEFSPVKNAEGSDSPETCRADLSRIGRAIAAAAGAGAGSGAVEMDPRVAESRREFTAGAPVAETTPQGVVYRS